MICGLLTVPEITISSTVYVTEVSPVTINSDPDGRVSDVSIPDVATIGPVSMLPTVKLISSIVIASFSCAVTLFVACATVPVNVTVLLPEFNLLSNLSNTLISI